MRKSILLLLIISMACMIMPVNGITGEVVPEKMQVAFIFKIFNFDRALAGRAGSEVTIGVLSAGDTSVCANIKSELAGSSEKKMAGLSFKVSDITLDQVASGLQNISILYVPPGNEADIASIVSAAKAQKTRTFTCDEGLVKSGVSVGVVLQDGKPKIMINRGSAEESGADFSATVLKLAKVI